jgi:hypothetical protein
MVAPPLELGAVKAMLALPLPAVAAPMVGAPGTVTVDETGVTDTEPEAEPVPALLVAVTVQAYCVLLVNPVTEIGLLVPVTVPVVAPLALQVAV